MENDFYQTFPLEKFAAENSLNKILLEIRNTVLSSLPGYIAYYHVVHIIRNDIIHSHRKCEICSRNRFTLDTFSRVHGQRNE